MDDILDQDLIDEFIADSRDHLEAIEPDLLSLERDGIHVSPEIINRVFRAMHSIKGASGFFGFDALMTLSHAMENVFMKIRDGEMRPDPEKTDTLLAGADKVRLLVEAVSTGEDVAYRHELDGLNAMLNGNPETSGPGKQKEADGSRDTAEDRRVLLEKSDDGHVTIHVNGGPALDETAFELDESTLLSTLTDSGEWLYAVWINPNRDLYPKTRTAENFLSGLVTIGSIITHDLHDRNPAYSGSASAQPLFFHLLFRTIIDVDLIENALEIPISQIFQLDKEQIDMGRAVVKKPLVVKPVEKKRTSPPASMTKSLPTGETRSSETIRVSVELIDKLMNLAGELVLGRNQLRQELAHSIYHSPKLGVLMQDVATVTSEVQENIMQMRMQPVGNLFNKFIRIVRDLSRQLCKEAELVIKGKTVELDKSILEGLSDPMTHLIRNCMDHALESPDERVAKGKPRVGTIHVKAFHEGGQVNILVADDGKGINAEAVAEQAISSGAVSAETCMKMSDKEKLNLIFLPGLSTAETVTDVSGRGVGMDVVKTNIEKLGGHVEIDSLGGAGTTVRIRLPLTLAIIPSLTVGTAGRRFAIPQVNVQELVRIRAADVPSRIENLGEVEVLRLREKLLPLVCLAEVLGLERTIIHPKSGKKIKERRRQLADRRNMPDDKTRERNDHLAASEENRKNVSERRRYWRSDINVVVLRIGAHSFGITVDELFDNEEIVVKPLSKYIKQSKCFAGATIMGDGRVAMILDAAGIAEFSNLYFTEVGEEERRRREEHAKNQTDARGRRQAILLFNNASDERFAFRLDEISRLEKISPRSIHRVGTQDYVKYRHEGLPLIHLERLLPVNAVQNNAEELFVIIPKTNDTAAGIIVSRILDTVVTEATVQRDSTTPKGVYGSAFVEGELTMFLNPNELLGMFKNTIA